MKKLEMNKLSYKEIEAKLAPTVESEDIEGSDTSSDDKAISLDFKKRNTLQKGVSRNISHIQSSSIVKNFKNLKKQKADSNYQRKTYSTQMTPKKSACMSPKPKMHESF